jgi:hypothetical protein
MVSKIDVAVIAASFAGCTFWIEQGHHIAIDAPTPSELAGAAPAAACPDNDRVPYSAACLAFLAGDNHTTPGWRIATTDRIISALVFPPGNTEINSAACPDNDNVPYPSNCLRFMSGYFWRPD